MSFKKSFEIPGLPKMPNQLLGAHWTIRSSHAKKWHLMTGLHAGPKPPKPLSEAIIICERHSSVCPDFDGLCGSFKPVMDALVKLGFIKDDNMYVIKSEYYWVKCAPSKGKIKVSIEEAK